MLNWKPEYSILAAIFVILVMFFASPSAVFAEGGWVGDRDTGCEVWISSDAGLVPYFRGAASETKRSFTWNGACRDGKLDGSGLMQVFEGSLMKTYEGPFVKGHQTGKGIEIWYPGTKYQDRYEGDFLDGAKSGFGIQTWGSSGARYEGQWKNGMRNGQGTTTWPNGKVETGRYQDNVFIGP